MKTLTTLLTFLAIGLQAWGLSASDAFVSAPKNVFPLLEYNTRLDMIDYFNSGSTTASTNRLNGKSKLTSLTPEKIDIEMTDASSYSIFIIPNANDTIIGLISTVSTPTPDSRLNIFDKQWNDITSKSYQTPVLNDWLTKEGKDHEGDVEITVPFLLTSYSYDPSTKTLTITNTTENFLSDDLYDMVRPYLRQSLTYKWDNKKFNLQK